MKQIQRVISLLLALVLTLGTVPPMAVRAEETEPTQAVTEAVAETTVPTETATEPVEETTASTEAVTKAVEETTAPTEVATEPVEETTVPTEAVTEPTAPAEQETAGAQTMADAVAASTVASGTVGENLTWTLDDTGTFTVSGTGPMEDMGFIDDPYPWEAYMSDITSVIIEEGVTYIGIIAFKEATNLTEISIASTVKGLGGRCFSNCDSLEYVFIPAGIDFHYGGAWFAHCDNLKEIEVSADNTYLCSVDGVVFDKNMTHLWQYPGGKMGPYTVPTSVKGIESSAFQNCQGLTAITLPEGLEYISVYAFQFCDGLTEVIIPDSVTMLDQYCFWGCDNLERIEISKNIETISWSAFYTWDKNNKLEEIVFRGNAPEMKSDIFTGITATAYYPSDNAAWTADMLQNYGGTITWVPYISGEDPWIDGPKFRDYFNNDTIKINGAGSAYAYYVGEPNTVYSYLGGSREGIVTSDENGVFRIPLGNFDSVGTYKVNTEIIQIAGEALEEPAKLDAKVTVTPFTYTQEWELSMDASVAAKLKKGVDLNLPFCELDATLGGIEAEVGAGNAMTISREFSGNEETLELTSDIKIESGASVKSGITADVLNLEFSPVSASAGVKGSLAGTYGLKIEDYSAANSTQQRAVATYLLGEALTTNPYSLIFKPFYHYLAESAYDASGATIISGSSVGLSGSVSGNLAAFKVNGEDLFKTAGGGGKVSVSMSEKRDSAGEKEKTASYKTESELKLMVTDLPGIVGDVSVGADIMGTDIKVSAKQNDEGKSIKVTALDGTTAAPDFSVFGKKYSSNYHEYTFKDGALKGLLSSSPHFDSYLNGKRMLLSVPDLGYLAGELATTSAPVDYSNKRKDQALYTVPFDLGGTIVVGGELEVELSYLQSAAYTTATGYGRNGELWTTSASADPAISVMPDGTDLVQFFKDVLKSLANDVKKFFKTVTGKVQDGVESAWGWIEEKTGSAANWVVSIVTADGLDVASAWNTSYHVAVLNSNPAAMLTDGAADYGNSQSSEAATIGRPFLVTVTDGVTGAAITDLSAEPLEFTIRYAPEDLQAAGLSILHPTVQSGGIAMYRYSDDGDYFEYVGGTNDLEAMTVTAKITKPGQYVLAVDACAPALSKLDISDYRETPTITAYIDDLTGLNADSFSFKLDGVVKVNGANVAQYYDTAAGIFTYTVSEAEKLSEGEHTLSFTLADTTGNVQTYEYSFQVDLTAPKITKVTAEGNTNAGSVVEIRARVSDANLTAVYAVLSKLLPDGTWSQEVTTPMGDMGEGLWGLDYEGDGSTIRVSVKAVDIAENETVSELYEAYPFAEGVTLSQEYIALKAGQKQQLTAEVQPAELAKSIQWSVESNKDSVITVDQNGVVTAKGAGTDYVIATVVDGEKAISARCRVDVAEPIRIEGIQLSTTNVTSELYSSDYAQFDILLQLPQNVSIMSLEDRVIPESMSVAIAEAQFTDSGAKAAFHLVPLDDRRIAMVPTDEALKNPGGLAKSYKSKVTVVVDGREYTTAEEMSITLKQSKPKLKATVPAFNAFYTGQTQKITVTGGTLTGISGKEIPEWLTLNQDGTLTLNEKAGTKNSGKAVLLVDTEEWIIPAEVKLSVKKTYKVPGLKLSASSVKLAANAADSSGIALKLLPRSKKDTLSGLNVQGIAVADGYNYSVVKFDPETGEFILKAENGFRAGSIVLNVSFSDTREVLPLKLKVATQTVSLKLALATVTLNKHIGDRAQIKVTAAPADYKLTALDVKGNEAGELDISYENGILTVGTNAQTKSQTYTLSVSAGNSKPVTLKVKITEDLPTVALKAKSTIDLSFPERTVSVVPTFKNYAGGEIADYTVKVIAPDGTATDAFEVSYEDGAFLVECRDTEAAAGTYRLHLTLELNNNVTLEADTKLTVKRTAVKLKLTPGSLTLNKKLGDQASVAINCTTKGYDFSGQPIWELQAQNKKDSAEGKLDIQWNDGRLQIAVNGSTEVGATYNLQVKANKHAPAVNLAIKIVDVNPTVSLKASGTIDVIREGTSILVTPAYRNCMELSKSETLKVYSSADNFTNPVDGLFSMDRDDLGRFVLTAAPGLDHTKTYKVELESTVSGVTVKSPKVSVKVKMGSAKLTLTADGNTMFGNDCNDRIAFRMTAKDHTLNGVKKVVSRDARFEIVEYGNGEFALAFAKNSVDRSLLGKTVSVSLDVFLEGNETVSAVKPKANATLKLKVSIVK